MVSISANSLAQTMVLIIEGCDKSGKTTLINKLIKTFPGIMVKITDRPLNASPEERQKIIYHYQRVIKFIKENPEVIFILDRFFPSEYAYCIKRGYEVDEKFMEIEFFLLGIPHLLVLCDPGESEIRTRMEKESDDYVSIEENLKIRNRYLDFFEKTRLRKLKLDTAQPVEQLVKLIESNEHQRHGGSGSKQLSLF